MGPAQRRGPAQWPDDAFAPMDREELLSLSPDEGEANLRLLRSLNLTGADGKNIVLDTCRLRGCRAGEACFAGAGFKDVSFFDCDFSNADFRGASFTRCLFENCKGVGAAFVNAELFGSRFKGCKLGYANFNGAAMQAVRFSDTDISAGFMGRCRLSDVEMEGVNLSGVNLSGTSLKGLDLRRCDLSAIAVTPADLRGAVVTSLQASALASLFGLIVQD